MSERDETVKRIAGQFPRGVQGAKGDRGEPGEPGESGVSPAVRRAFAYLFVCMFLLIALAFAGLWYLQRANSQDKCSTILQISDIPVPRPVAGHESRQFAAALEAIYHRRAEHLGCR